MSSNGPIRPPIPAMHDIFPAPSADNLRAALSTISPTSEEPEQAYMIFGALLQPHD
jgi:hypothetical protein